MRQTVRASRPAAVPNVFHQRIGVVRPVRQSVQRRAARNVQRAVHALPVAQQRYIAVQAAQRARYRPPPPLRRPNIYGDQPVVHGPPQGPLGTPGGPTHFTHGGLSLSRGLRNIAAALRGAAFAEQNSQIRHGYMPNATERLLGNWVTHPGRSFRHAALNEQAVQTQGVPSGGLGAIRPDRALRSIGVVGAQAVVHGNFHPLWKTAKGLAEIPLGAVPGVIQAASDPAGALKGWEASGQRYYGGTTGQFDRRVRSQGATQGIVDLATFLAPTGASAGRGITRIARARAEAGASTGRVARFLTEPRPNLRMSGTLARRQDLSPNAFVATAQRAQDAIRVNRADARAGRTSARPSPVGHGKAGLQPRSNADFAAIERDRAGRHNLRAQAALDAGNPDLAAIHAARAQAAHHLANRILNHQRQMEVVAASKIAQRRLQRVAASEIQTRHFQRLRNEQAAEIDRGLQRDLSGLGTGKVGKLRRDAAQLVVRGLVSAKDPGAAVNHLVQLRDAVQHGFSTEGFAGRPMALREVQALIDNAPKVFGPELEAFRAKTVARIARVRQGDLAVKDLTAEVHPHRGQAFVMGVQHPYDQAVARLDAETSAKLAAGPKVDVGALEQVFTKHERAAMNELVKERDAAGPVAKRQHRANAEAEWAKAVAARDQVTALRDPGSHVDRVNAEHQAALDALDAQKPAMDRQFIDAVKEQARLTDRPTEPGYVKDFKHRSQVESRISRTIGSSFTPAEGVRRSDLSLLSTGRNDYSHEALTQSMALVIRRKHNWGMYGDQLRAHGLKPPTQAELAHILNRTRNLEPGKLTADDWRTVLAAQGHDTRDWAIFNPGKFLKHRRNADTADHQFDHTAHGTAELPDYSAHDAIAESVSPFPKAGSDAAQVRGVQVLPRAAYNEIAPGSTLHSLFGRSFDKAMGLQARWILGAGALTWEPIQIAANAFLSAIAVGGNPLAFVHGVREFAKLPPDAQAAAHEMFGTGIGDAAGHRVYLGAAAGGDLANWGRAFQAAVHSRFRAQVDRVPALRNVHLNPIDLAFQVDHAQNAYFKKVVFTTKLKREMWGEIQRNAGLGARALAQVQDLLRGAPKDQLARISRNPQVFDRAARFANDVLGDYVRYTSRERRGLKRFVLFYGFMRYALRTLFYTMPVHHPIVAAVVAKLAQLHNDEVKDLLGGDQAPWAYSRLFFTKPGIGGLASMLGLSPADARAGRQAALHNGLYSIDSARVNPVSTPISDLATEGWKAGGSFIAPMISTLIDQLYTKDSFTGLPFTHGTSPEEAKNFSTGDHIRNIFGQAINTYFAPARWGQRLAAHGRRESSTSLPLIDPQYLRYKSGGPAAAKAAQRQNEWGRSGNGIGSVLAPLLFPTLDNSRDVVAQRQRLSGGVRSSGAGIDWKSVKPAGSGSAVPGGIDWKSVGPVGTKGAHADYPPNVLAKLGTRGLIDTALRHVGNKAVGRLGASALAQGGPIFTAEGPAHYAAAYKRNRPFAKPGPYQTKLSPQQERQFRHWVKSNGVPFDPNAKTVDYNMRGYFKATGGKGWRPGSHFPDTFKTPYDTTFSRESKYATKDNPFVWRGNTLVDRRSGRPAFASPAPAPPGETKAWHIKLGPDALLQEGTGAATDAIGKAIMPQNFEKQVGKKATIPVAYKQKLFAHPQRPNNRQLALAQLQGVKLPNLKAAGPGPRTSPKLLHRLAVQLKANGYSTQQIRAHIAGGRSLKQLGFPAHTQKGVVEAAAKRHGVPPSLLWGVYGAETAFGTNHNTSSAGAQGPFQFMPGTADSWIKGGRKNVGDFHKAADGAARLLGHLLQKYHGNTTLAAAAYNAGEGNVDKAHGVPPIAETQAYVRRVAQLGKGFGGKGNGGVPFVMPSGGVPSSSGVPSSGGGGVPASGGGGNALASLLSAATGAGPKGKKAVPDTASAQLLSDLIQSALAPSAARKQRLPYMGGGLTLPWFAAQARFAR